MIVQDVGEPREAPRAVGHLGRQRRDAGQEQDRKAAGELEIIALRSRPVAQGREVDDAALPATRSAASSRPSIVRRGLSSRPFLMRSNAAASAVSASSPSGVW